MTGVNWVMLHGWGSDSSVWQDLFAVWGQKATLVDLAGFGSCVNQAAPSLDAYLAHIAEQLPRDCVLVGWSLGGMLATRLAQRYPAKVKGLVTLACNPSFVVRDNWPHAMMDATYQAFCRQFNAEPRRTWERFAVLQSQGDGLGRQVRRRLMVQDGPDPRNIDQWCTALRWLQELDNRDSVQQLECPQLHLFGQGDALVPIAVAEWVAHSVVLPDVGHAPHLSNPRVVVDQINGWFERHFSRRISKQRIAQSFSSSALHYDSVAYVQRDIARRLVNRLADGVPGPDVLDLGCGTGFVAAQLAERGVTPMVVDIAEAMVALALRKQPGLLGCVADAEMLPLTDASLDAVVSSLTFQWCDDLVAVMREAHRALRPGGVLAFTTLASQTLFELKQAWAEVDAYVHVNDFLSVEDIDACVEQAGFSVLHRESYQHKVWFNDVMVLLRELKTLGARNLNAGSNKGLTLRSRLRRLSESYQRFADDEGRCPATYDVMLMIVQKADSQ